MRVSRLTSFAFALVLTLPALGDQFPTLARGFEPGKVYEFGEIDNVNVYNGNLIITIPIGQRLRLNGGLSFGLSLTYNSKVWDLEQAGGVIHADPTVRSNAGMGWLLSMGRLLGPHDASNNSADYVYESPDGAEHAIDHSNVGTTAGFPLYSADGSNLRLRRVDATTLELDSPDGAVRRFVRSGTVWDLTRIRSFMSADEVEVRQPAPADYEALCPNATLIWQLRDSYQRSQFVCFKHRSYAGTARPMVDRVLTMGPGDGEVPQTKYVFEYDTNIVVKPFEDTDYLNQNRPPDWSVPMLKTLKLPDGVSDACASSDCSTYVFASSPAADNKFTGMLKSLTLPTKGTVEYGYEPMAVPSLDMCADAYGGPGHPGLGYGGQTTGVVSRAFWKGDQLLGKWIYRRELTGGYVAVTDCNTTGQGDPVHPTLYDAMVVTVEQPSGDQVRNHFSVWPGNDVGRVPDRDTSPAGFKRDNYGAPLGAYDAYQGRYLSQEIQKCTAGTCTTVRAIYTNRENLCPNCASRTISQRTWYTDDPPGCAPSGATPTCRYTGEDFLPSSWDGYGHYRTVTTSGNLRGEPSIVESRTVTTNFNPGSGTNGLIGSVMAIPPGENWVINTFDSVTTSDGSAQAKEQFCFNKTNGFLKARRGLFGSAPQANDLLSIFVQHATEGNLETEKYYGGDAPTITAPAATDPNVCTAAESAVATAPLGYQISHTWLRGIETAVAHSGVAFKDKEITIDLSGFVTDSKDSSGLATHMSYDRLGRLTTVTPPGEASTSLTYRQASLSGTTLTPANALLQRGSGASMMKAEYQYDAFGRLFREKRWMPDAKWSLRETRTDSMGRKTSESEWRDLTASDENTFVPPLGTVLGSYDAVGRVGTVHTPDGHDTIFTYMGARIADRKVLGVATAPVSDVITRNVSDSFGRLASVTENYTVTGFGSIITNYEYDVHGNLKRVCANSSGAACGQERLFTYDPRGLLISEKHPENGIFNYTYDSRGHTRTRTRSDTTSFDLRYDYDSAERVTAIDFVKNSVYVHLKTFAYDTADHYGQGKPVSATRLNYLPDGIVSVTERYDYNDAAGRLTNTSTTITLPDQSSRVVSQSQSYDGLGQPLTTVYPSCQSCGASQWTSVTQAYEAGFFKSSITSNGDPVTSQSSPVAYWPSGMVHTLTHGNGVVDTVGIDANSMMARPTSISFGTFAACSGVTIFAQPQSPTPVSGNNTATFFFDARGTGTVAFQWYDATTQVAILGATSASFTTPPIFSDRSYYAVAFNACGRVQSNVVIATAGCPTTTAINTQPANATISGGTATFHVVAVGTNITYQWYRNAVPDTSNPVGTNSDTYQATGLTQSTPYWVRVSGCTSVNSNTAWALISLAPPANLVATAAGTTQVTVTWSAVPGAIAYRVERSNNGGASWSAAATLIGNANTSAVDSLVSASTAYLYRVKAGDGTPNESPYSNVDLATTVAFTTPSGGLAIAHFNELLVAVNALLTASAHPTVQWTNILQPAGIGQPPAPGVGVPVLGEHLAALRRTMVTAYGYLGLPPPSFTDSNIPAGAVAIKAIHISELQGAVR
jgi:YD repeat-containing protein